MGMDFNAIGSLFYNSITFDIYMTLPNLLKLFALKHDFGKVCTIVGMLILNLLNEL
jgi:hypothetical protein